MIRGLAITDVNSIEKYLNIVLLCEEVKETKSHALDLFGDYISDGKFSVEIFDDGSTENFMYGWLMDEKDNINDDESIEYYNEQRAHLEKCRKLTYSQFLREYDKNYKLDIKEVYDGI